MASVGELICGGAIEADVAPRSSQVEVGSQPSPNTDLTSRSRSPTGRCASIPKIATPDPAV